MRAGLRLRARGGRRLAKTSQTRARVEAADARRLNKFVRLHTLSGTQPFIAESSRKDLEYASRLKKKTDRARHGLSCDRSHRSTLLASVASRTASERAALPLAHGAGAAWAPSRPSRVASGASGLARAEAHERQIMLAARDAGQRGRPAQPVRLQRFLFFLSLPFSFLQFV
jgi:hypothetical protein